MKTLFLLLHILLCQGVVAFNDTNRKVGIENVGNADGKVLLALPSNKLPFALARVVVDHSDTTVSSFILFDKTNVKVGTAFGNDTYFAVDASCHSKRGIDAILSPTGKPIVLEINFSPRPGLSESGHGHQGKSKYEKKPLHAANITNS